jgi:hypothetical protein
MAARRMLLKVSQLLLPALAEDLPGLLRRKSK